MKRRIYLIAALALINLVVMKYNEMKGERRGATLTLAANGQAAGVDSLLTSAK